MYIKDDYDFRDLRDKCWSGAVDTLDMIAEANREDELMALLEEQFYDDIPTITEVNDFLWFEGDFIKESLGIHDWYKFQDLIDVNLVDKVAKELKSEMDNFDEDEAESYTEDYEMVLNALDNLESEIDSSVKDEEFTDDLELIVGTLTGQTAWMINNKKFESMMGEISDWIDENK